MFLKYKVEYLTFQNVGTGETALPHERFWIVKLPYVLKRGVLALFQAGIFPEYDNRQLE